MMRFLSVLAGCAALLIAGCQGDSETAAGDGGREARDPLSIAGRYFFAFSQQGPQGFVDLHPMLLEFPDGPGRIRIVESSEHFPEPKLREASVQAGLVRFVVEIDRARLDFEGQVRGGEVWGNVYAGGLGCVPARLFAADGQTLEDHAQPEPSRGTAELQKLLQSRPEFDDFVTFCRQNPRSPASVQIRRQLVAGLKSEAYDEARTKSFIDESLEAAKHWGPRMEQVARFYAGYDLLNTAQFPAYGMALIEQAQSEFDDSLKSAAEPQVERAKQIYDIVRAHERAAEARRLVADGKPAEAAAILNELHERHPFDPIVTYELAEYERQAGDAERALALFGELVALPTMEHTLIISPAWRKSAEAPSSVLHRLWREARGSAAGLDEFLDETYLDRVGQVATTAALPAADAAGSRVVLGELFTGAQCPPCVAADVASMALEETYPRSDLVILRYHQHIPAEDPLANQHSMQRFAYYAGEQLGTPTYVVNGRRVESNVGGSLAMSVDVYGALRSLIDPQLSQDSPLGVTLSAEEAGGTVRVKATVDAGDAPAEGMRLKLVLAEDDIAFPASNGIRRHRLIVRHIFDGLKGVEIKGGGLEHLASVSLDELRRQLSADLELVEDELGRKFSDKPLDLRSLQVVAIVQVERTGEVVQAALAPVERTKDEG